VDTTQRFTGSTSLTVTVARTPLALRARNVFYNGVLMDPNNVLQVGTAFTLSGLTGGVRLLSDVIEVKYTY
jgi:hypothetical protein